MPNKTHMNNIETKNNETITITFKIGNRKELNRFDNKCKGCKKITKTKSF